MRLGEAVYRRGPLYGVVAAVVPRRWRAAVDRDGGRGEDGGRGASAVVRALRGGAGEDVGGAACVDCEGRGGVALARSC